jgi:hypothetical protein
MDAMKVYLGSAIYMDVDDGGGVLLTTEIGSGITNRIYLDPDVLNAALRAFRAAEGFLARSSSSPSAP